MSNPIEYTQEQWVRILEALPHRPFCPLPDGDNDLVDECFAKSEGGCFPRGYTGMRMDDFLAAALRALGDRPYRRALLPFIHALRQEAEHCRTNRGGVFESVAEPNDVAEFLSITSELNRWCLGEPVTWNGDGGTVNLQRASSTADYCDDIRTFDEGWLWAAMTTWKCGRYYGDDDSGKGDDEDDGGNRPTPCEHRARRLELIDA
jgi:hypothetical protein